MSKLILAAIGAALIFCGAASAATITDLQGFGYTVSISNPGPAGQNCPTYYISGHGLATYLNCNTPQADIDSLANPTVICNADWQNSHPDQRAALEAIASKGWGVSGDQCVDTYTVTNPAGNQVAYSGSGGGLPSFNAQNGSPPGQSTNPPGACLPLCPNPGENRGANGKVLPPPAQAPLTESSVIAPISDPLSAAAASSVLFSDRSAGYIVRAGYGYGGALNTN